MWLVDQRSQAHSFSTLVRRPHMCMVCCSRQLRLGGGDAHACAAWPALRFLTHMTSLSSIQAGASSPT